MKKKEMPFKVKCSKTEINYYTAYAYKRKHPELSDEEVIIHYRPDLLVNIFGKIILDNGEVLN